MKNNHCINVILARLKMGRVSLQWSSMEHWMCWIFNEELNFMRRMVSLNDENKRFIDEEQWVVLSLTLSMKKWWKYLLVVSEMVVINYW